MLSSILQSTKLALALHHELLMYAGGGGRGDFMTQTLVLISLQQGTLTSPADSPMLASFGGLFVTFAVFFIHSL